MTDDLLGGLGALIAWALAAVWLTLHARRRPRGPIGRFALALWAITMRVWHLIHPTHEPDAVAATPARHCTCGSNAPPEPVEVDYRDGKGPQIVAVLCPDCGEKCAPKRVRTHEYETKTGRWGPRLYEVGSAYADALAANQRINEAIVGVKNKSTSPGTRHETWEDDGYRYSRKVPLGWDGEPVAVPEEHDHDYSIVVDGQGRTVRAYCDCGLTRVPC